MVLDYHKTWGEPGGRRQWKYSIERSAKNETYEETCTIVDLRNKGLKNYIDISGNKKGTIYRSYFTQIKPVTLDKYHRTRNKLKREKADPKYLETTDITYVEIRKLDSKKVVDVFGKTIKLSPRFKYVLYKNGLKYLQCYYTGFYSRHGLIKFQ